MVSETLKNIDINGKTYTISAFTGKVVDCQKRNETTISGSGGGGYISNGSGFINSISIKSKTKVHDRLFLIDKFGQEHSFQFQNYDLACRKGHKLSILEIQTTPESSSKNIAIYNHSTRKMSWNMLSLSALYKSKSLLNFYGFLIITIIASVTKLWILWIIVMFVLFLRECNKRNIEYNRAKLFSDSGEAKRLIDYLNTM